LAWRRAKPDSPPREPRADQESVTMGPGWRLRSTEPAARLTERIRDTSRFTLLAVAASDDPDQVGLARIVSLAESGRRRNFTFGQDESQLVFRFRTLLSGMRANTELEVDGVIRDTDPHHYALTYDGTELLLYVDGRRHRRLLEFAPWTIPFSYLGSLKAQFLPGYRTLYFGAVFIPLGALLAFTAATAAGPLTGRSCFVTLFAAAALPALLFEAQLNALGSHTWSADRLVLGTSLTAAGALFTWWQTRGR
jgi:hypothetical protein